jgi:hypothetical protein
MSTAAFSVAQKHSFIAAAPALSTYPLLTDPDALANGRLIKYRVYGGGSVKGITVQNLGPASLNFSVETSSDNTNWYTPSAPGTAGANGISGVNLALGTNSGTTVTPLVIAAGSRRTYELSIPSFGPTLAPNTVPNTGTAYASGDLYVRITATGGTQFYGHIESDANLSRVIYPTATYDRASGYPYVFGG